MDAKFAVGRFNVVLNGMRGEIELFSYFFLCCAIVHKPHDTQFCI